MRSIEPLKKDNHELPPHSPEPDKQEEYPEKEPSPEHQNPHKTI